MERRFAVAACAHTEHLRMVDGAGGYRCPGRGKFGVTGIADIAGGDVR